MVHRLGDCRDGRQAPSLDPEIRQGHTLVRPPGCRTSAALRTTRPHSRALRPRGPILHCGAGEWRRRAPMSGSRTRAVIKFEHHTQPFGGAESATPSYLTGAQQAESTPQRGTLLRRPTRHPLLRRALLPQRHRPEGDSALSPIARHRASFTTSPSPAPRPPQRGRRPHGASKSEQPSSTASCKAAIPKPSKGCSWRSS